MRHLRFLSVSSVLFLLAGCPDPSSTAEGTASTPGAPGAPGTPGEVQPGAAPGSAPAPAPGGSGRPVPPGFKIAAGEGVKLSGTISYSGSKSGTLRLDFLKPPSGGSLPELLDSIELKEAGAWEVEAPKNAGDLAIVAYLDAADDGPSAGDPAGRVKGTVTVKEEAQGGLEIKLEDEPDLGDLKPGQPGALPTSPPPPVDPGAAAPSPATPPEGAAGVPSTAGGAATDPNAKPADGAADAKPPTDGAPPSAPPADAPK